VTDACTNVLAIFCCKHGGISLKSGMPLRCAPPVTTFGFTGGPMEHVGTCVDFRVNHEARLMKLPIFCVHVHIPTCHIPLGSQRWDTTLLKTIKIKMVLKATITASQTSQCEARSPMSHPAVHMVTVWPATSSDLDLAFLSLTTFTFFVAISGCSINDRCVCFLTLLSCARMLRMT